RVDIGLRPALIPFGLVGQIDRHRLRARLLAIARNLIEEFSPRWIVRYRSAFFDDQLFELLDAELLHDEFEARLLAVFLFAQPGKHPPNGPRHWQQLFFRQEIENQLGLMRYRSEAAADVELKAAAFLALDG